MKKILFIIFALLTTATLFAEEQTTTIPFTTADYVWRSGTHIYYGDQQMSRTEYKNFLKNTCPRAYGQYKKADNLMKAGWSVFGVGAAFFTIGGILCIADAAADYDTGWGIVATLVNVPITGACLAVSVPMLCVGYKERDRSIATYNMLCHDEPPITYHITAGENGIGFAVNF